MREELRGVLMGVGIAASIYLLAYIIYIFS
jgi:hypothetical protein